MPRRLTRLAVRAGATALLAATCAVATPNGTARAAASPASAAGASAGAGSAASVEADSPASAGSDSPASSGARAAATSSAAVAGAGPLQVSGAGSVCAVPATSPVSAGGGGAVTGGRGAGVAGLPRAGGRPRGAAGAGGATPAPWASYLYLTSRAGSAQSVGPAGATVGIGSAVVQPELAPSASAGGPDWRPAGSLPTLIAFDATLSRESNPSGGGSAADYAARTSALQGSGASTLAGLVSDWWNTDAGFRGTAAGQDGSGPAGAAVPAGSATTLLGIRYPTDASARPQYAVLPLVGSPVAGGAVGSRQLLGVLVVQHAVSAAPSLITPGSVSAVAHGVRDADFDALTVVDPMLESVDGVCAPADTFANAHPDAAVRAAISQDGRTLQTVAPSRLAPALNLLPAGDYQVSFTYTAFDGATVSSALPTTVTLTGDGESPSSSPPAAAASPAATGASPSASAGAASAGPDSGSAAAAPRKYRGKNSFLELHTNKSAALWSLALLGGAIAFAVLGVRVLRQRRH
ncbi:MAG: hypothetical protein ABF811_00985 [Pseudoclavibacter sp.]